MPSWLEKASIKFARPFAPFNVSRTPSSPPPPALIPLPFFSLIAVDMGQFFSSAVDTPNARLLHDKEVRSSSETFTEHKSHPVTGNPSILTRAKGHYWYPDDGGKILDACGGAGVACIGHGREDVIKEAMKQMKLASYTSYAHFKTTAVESLVEWLIESTEGHMQKVFLMCSGKRHEHVVSCASDIAQALKRLRQP